MLAVTPEQALRVQARGQGATTRSATRSRSGSAAGLRISTDRSGGMTALTIESPAEGEKVTLVGIGVKDDPVSRELMQVLRERRGKAGLMAIHKRGGRYWYYWLVDRRRNRLRDRLLRDRRVRAEALSKGGAPRGGIDLGGTKIQAAVVDATGKVLGEARHPTPTSGGPADVAAGDGRRRCGRPRSRPGSRPAGLAGDRRRLARRRRREDRCGLRGAQSARLGGQLPARREARRQASGARCGSATTSRSRPKPSSSSAPGASSRA